MIFKVTATVSWEFDSKLPFQDTIDLANKQLEKILDCSPYGEDYSHFAVVLSLQNIKNRKETYKHLKEFPLDQVLPLTDKQIFIVKSKTYQVNMNSTRYELFRQNSICVSCGLVGEKMILDLQNGSSSPHFNLYGMENGRLVMMNKDHIIPKSREGLDSLDNYQTMCIICNSLKGHYDLTPQQVLTLRELNKNPQKLPQKELNLVIHEERMRMAGNILILN